MRRARARVVPVCYWSGGSLNTDHSLVSTVVLLSTLTTTTHLQLSPADPAATVRLQAGMLTVKIQRNDDI